MSDADTAVWIDPGRRSGEPCVGGSRVPVEMVVGVVWHHGFEEALTQWPHLTRAGILTACWYAGAGNVVRLHGKGGKYVAHRGPWRKRWGAWAVKVHQALWESRYDDVAEPPQRPSDVPGGTTDTRDRTTGAPAGSQGRETHCRTEVAPTDGDAGQ